MIDLKRILAAKPKNKPIEELGHLSSPFGDEVRAALAADPAFVPRNEHPRPQFARSSYRSLNGRWHCTFVDFPYDPKADTCALLAAAAPPAAHAFDTPVTVPFSPEADLSGVGVRLDPDRALWYRGSFPAPEPAPGERCLLHFEGVDDCCAVWCNGTLLGTHAGGYLPFSFDITDALKPSATNARDAATAAGEDAPASNRADAPAAGEPAGETPAEESAGTFTLVLCVTDPTEQGVQLRGKQTLNRSDLWYSAQSGIWQPVWLETVPAAHIASARITPDARTGDVRVEAVLAGLGSACAAGTPVETSGTPAGAPDRTPVGAPAGAPDRTPDSGALSVSGFSVEVRASGMPDANDAPGALVAQAECPAGAFRGNRATVTLRVSNPRLWSPDDPFLYDLVLRYGGDEVRSYCAFRTTEVRTDDTGTARFFLNGKPLFLRGVLDQGYWPESHMTAPSDAAFVHDIREMRACGFNMLRKHIKLESDRFYYHCDRLGMLVWQDMVSGGGTYDELHTMYIPTLFARSWSAYSDKKPKHLKALSADSPRYRRLWMNTCLGAVEHLGNHPCIVTWVLFNEGWGQFESAAACERVRAADPTRPIEAVSGWYDQGAGSFHGVHNYFRPLQLFPDRTGRKKAKGARTEAAKRSSAARTPRTPRASVTCEFGGLVLNLAGHAQLPRSFGYEVHDSLPSWQTAVRAQLARMDELEREGMAGYVYTQLSDVEEETNGILTYDRCVNKLLASENAE